MMIYLNILYQGAPFAIVSVLQNFISEVTDLYCHEKSEILLNHTFKIAIN